MNFEIEFEQEVDGRWIACVKALRVLAERMENEV